MKAKKPMYEKEFLKTFAKHVILAKEKIKVEKEQKEREKAKEASKKRIEKIKEKIRTAVLKEKKAARKKIEELVLEKDASEKKVEKAVEKAEEKIFPAPKPTPSAVLPPPTARSIPVPAPPISRKASPVLPKPPKITTALPLPPLPHPPKAPVPKPVLATAIDLGKINPLIQDVSISTIQCEGANLPIKITKEGKTIDTAIKLNETEIKDIIYKFSARAGLALTEPVFKATIGELTITAVTSAFAGSKFVISRGH